MTLTTLEAEHDRSEQSLQEYPEGRSTRASSRSSIGDQTMLSKAGTDLVRARMPAPQERPIEDEPVVDSPPLHEAEQPEQNAEGEDGRRGGLLRRHPFAFSIGLLLLIPIAAFGYLYWDQSRHFESTDDAFIAARAFSIAPKISGYITAVPVTDNQHVAAGDVIAQIDDRDYSVALDQARAQVANAEANISNIDAQITAQQAQVSASQSQLEQAQAALVFAQQQADRYEQLAQKGSGTVQNAQQYASQLRQQQAAVATAQANLKLAQRQIDSLKAQRNSAVANSREPKRSATKRNSTSPTRLSRRRRQGVSSA